MRVVTIFSSNQCISQNTIKRRNKRKAVICWRTEVNQTLTQTFKNSSCNQTHIFWSLYCTKKPSMFYSEDSAHCECVHMVFVFPYSYPWLWAAVTHPACITIKSGVPETASLSDNSPAPRPRLHPALGSERPLRAGILMKDRCSLTQRNDTFHLLIYCSNWNHFN